MHINFPFIEALSQMPKYTKFLKVLLTNKARLEEACTTTMNEMCSAVLLNKLPSKEKDPWSFTIPCDIGQLHINNALANLGASISLMPYTMYEKLENIEYMVKVSEKARIMEHKQRVHESPQILTTYTAYHSKSICRTVFGFPPYLFNYPIRMLTIKEMLANIIDEGKRGHEEMEIFIKEFRTTKRDLYIVKGLLTIVKPQQSSIPFPNQVRKEKEEAPQRIFLENLKQLEINIPFIEALVQIPKYAKYLKSLLTNKSRLEEACTKTMNRRCSAVLLKELPSKEKDPWSSLFLVKLWKLRSIRTCGSFHLSRFENPHIEVLTEGEIADKFFDKHLMVLKSKFNNDEPCFRLVLNGTAQALPTNDARVVVKFLRSLFARFGVPKALISDRGTYFCNSQLEKALQRYGVTHKLSTAYHPQSNGQTEVTNRAIKRILERSVGYNPKDWSEKLNDPLWAFRMAYKTLTRCTPFRLVYGKPFHLPVEIEHKAHWASKQCNMDLTLASKSRLMRLNELAELRDGAYENTRIYKERTNKWHDSRLRGDKDFKVKLPLVNIEYMVKVSEKARIMEHKRRVQESPQILTTYTAYHSKSIRYDTINMETQELLANDKSDSSLLKGLEKSINQSDLESCKSLKNKFDDDSDLEKPIWPSANEIDEKKPELKIFPHHLEYAYLHGDKSLPIIISSKLSEKEKNVTFAVIQPQRRLNPKVQDVVKNKIVKLLDSELIYLISDSLWVSPIHVEPKKGGMIIVLNDNNELIPSHTVTGWRVCIDYHKLNDATRKDHFPLPFIDQILERLCGNEYYCFLDGFLGFFQIPIAPEDQEKTTFTCPYGTFAYKRMPFGLCKAPATFQRCMTAIFYDMVEDFMEVFMDDFSVFGNSFNCCLANLDRMLARCEETNLVLN
ncbi:reverse transcriptase domain-containing protein [Tanacetum coccineum]